MKLDLSDFPTNFINGTFILIEDKKKILLIIQFYVCTFERHRGKPFKDSVL